MRCFHQCQWCPKTVECVCVYESEKIIFINGYWQFYFEWFNAYRLIKSKSVTHWAIANPFPPSKKKKLNKAWQRLSYAWQMPLRNDRIGRNRKKRFTWKILSPFFRQRKLSLQAFNKIKIHLALVFFSLLFHIMFYSVSALRINIH